MEEKTALFETMAARGVERLRFQRRGESVRHLAARHEGDWEDAALPFEGAGHDLETVSRLFREGGHERLDLVLRPEVGLRFLCAVHSTAEGPGAGGLRRQDLIVPEFEVIQGTLDLARAMTYKNLVARVSRGGSKLCVYNTPLPEHAREAWLDLIAEEIDLSGTMTGPDMGFSLATFHDLAQRTSSVTGLKAGGTSLSAAYGVLQALNATAAALGLPLNESRIIIQGLGALGGELATHVAKSGARLTVTDQDHRRIDAFLSSLSSTERRLVGVVAPYQILHVEGDILSPCAVGQIIGRKHVRSLKCRAICGGANNQLVAHSLHEEIELARLLNEAGVLFVPDWLASAGGTIHGTLEVELGEEFDIKKVHARIRRVCSWQIDELLREAKLTGRPPLEIALEQLVRR